MARPVDDSLNLSTTLGDAARFGIRCGRDRQGFSFRLSGTLIVLTNASELVAQWETITSGRLSRRISIQKLRELRVVPDRRRVDGTASSMLEIELSDGSAITPVRGEPTPRVEWLAAQLNDWRSSENRGYVEGPSHPGVEFQTAQGAAKMSIARCDGRVFVRHGEAEEYREFDASIDGLEVYVVGWLEPRRYHWPADSIFDLRREIDGDSDDKAILYLKDGDRVILAVDYLEKAAIQWLADTLAAPMKLAPPSQRSCDYLRGFPRADDPGDAQAPGTPDGTVLSYARTPINAPVIHQARGVFTVHFPHASFWHDWIAGLLRYIPIIVWGVFGVAAISIFVRHSPVEVVLLNAAAGVVMFIALTVYSRDRSTRIIVSQGKLTVEVVARYWNRSIVWWCDEILAINVRGARMNLVVDQQLLKSRKVSGASPRMIPANAPNTLVRYEDRAELERVCDALRVATGLLPPLGGGAPASANPINGSLVR